MAGEVFKNRFTFIAAAVGMAVGTGNLWRFPRVVGEYGGGAFIIAIVVANLVWAIPVLMSESLLGSKSRLGTIGAFRDFMGRKFAWMGGFVGLVTVGILFYYSVVCGWALRYLVYAVTGKFNDSNVDTSVVWNDFTGSAWQPMLFHVISIAMVGYIVIRGVKRGFESVLNVVIPALFVILVILFIQALTLDGASGGLEYMFVPDWSVLTEADVWLQAFTQMAFSTGAGWGLYLTYAVYMRQKEDMATNAGILVSANLLASLFAATAVLCTLFSVRSAEYATTAAGNANQDFAFTYFAALFGQMTGGAIFGPLFFLALFLAGISSLIAMVELAARNIMDMGLTRQTSVTIVVVATLIAGIPSAYSVDFLTNQDNVWGIGLLISGLCVAVAMMKFGVERARKEMDDVSDVRVGKWWSVCIYAFPLMFVLLFGWWMQQALEDVPEPWNVTSTFSIGTMLLQWGVLALIMLALNNVLANKVMSGPMSASMGPGTPFVGDPNLGRWRLPRMRRKGGAE
ncbi:sodium-dependent transporter [Solicola gregarius]|uniref:Sodium-dependent transporter n=1 Tax=Solicola gregarius TaxID=2908642 RepID=A0AA46YM29_9ACTN|nr:sodium-dependent transporter [Solicola gregarius]UYM07272.1 sodium-dependent transporter [Solicola gregarius]